MIIPYKRGDYPPVFSDRYRQTVGRQGGIYIQHKSNFSRFLVLWAAELISATGSGLTNFGLAIYVFNRTGSAASMATVSLCAFLPLILFSIFAGVLADRYDRRVMMMIGDSFSALGIFYIWFCMLNGGASLWQICLGVFISSSFAALLEPSFRATITDLLNEQEYARASGMMGLASNAGYLISPVLAGILLIKFDFSVLLLIDVLTFFPTVLAAAAVRKDIAVKQKEESESFMESFKTGWNAIIQKRGILILIVVASLMNCLIGTIQVLCQSLILSFANSTVLGIVETICACGMLVSGVYLGIKGIRKNYVRVLWSSLLIAGICMAEFALFENLIVICVYGFAFFAMLPFANSALDYLVRTNIANELQGRAWGVIGFVSQIGYVISYAFAGSMADRIAISFDLSIGRGCAMVVLVAGIALAVVSIGLSLISSIRTLEQGELKQA